MLLSEYLKVAVRQLAFFFVFSHIRWLGKHLYIFVYSPNLVFLKKARIHYNFLRNARRYFWNARMYKRLKRHYFAGAALRKKRYFRSYIKPYIFNFIRKRRFKSFKRVNFLVFNKVKNQKKNKWTRSKSRKGLFIFSRIFYAKKINRPFKKAFGFRSGNWRKKKYNLRGKLLLKRSILKTQKAARNKKLKKKNLIKSLQKNSPSIIKRFFSTELKSKAFSKNLSNRLKKRDVKLKGKIRYLTPDDLIKFPKKKMQKSSFFLSFRQRRRGVLSKLLQRPRFRRGARKRLKKAFYRKAFFFFFSRYFLYKKIVKNTFALPSKRFWLRFFRRKASALWRFSVAKRSQSAIYRSLYFRKYLLYRLQNRVSIKNSRILNSVFKRKLLSLKIRPNFLTFNRVHVTKPFHFYRPPVRMPNFEVVSNYGPAIFPVRALKSFFNRNAYDFFKERFWDHTKKRKLVRKFFLLKARAKLKEIQFTFFAKKRALYRSFLLLRYLPFAKRRTFFLQNVLLGDFLDTLKKRLAFDLLNAFKLNFKLAFVFIYNRNVTPNVLSSFFMSKFKRMYLPGEVVTRFFNRLSRGRKRFGKYIRGGAFWGIRALMIKASGRFTRKQRAFYKLYKMGPLSLSTVRKKVIYDFKTAPLKFGAVGLKIYMLQDENKKNIFYFKKKRKVSAMVRKSREFVRAKKKAKAYEINT